jgi:hypothetical protein
VDGDDLPDLTVFKPLDLERYAKRLNLDARGAERGAVNLPATDAIALDDVESEIVSNIVGDRTQVRNDVIGRLRSLNELLARARSALTTTDLENRIAPKIASIEQQAMIGLHDLDEKQTRLIEDRADFSDWRKLRKLKRPARAPKGAFGFFADLFIIALAEGGLNLFFFSEGNDFGLLGAFFQALLIAGANILICTVVGFALFKRINSSFLLNKLLGFTSVATVLIGLPIVHIIVGFYRVARNTPEAAASPLWTAVTWFQDISANAHRLDELSIIMIVAGIIAGGYAIRKGYEFGDRYPDYTKRYKEAEAHRNAFLDELDAITGDMLEEQEQAHQAVSTFLYEVGPSLRAVENYTDRKSQLAAAIRNYEIDLEGGANTLLARYRAANTKHRSTPTPPHFGAAVSLPEPIFDGASIRDSTFATLLATQVDIADARLAAERALTAAKGQQERIERVLKATREQIEKSEQVRDGAQQ